MKLSLDENQNEMTFSTKTATEQNSQTVSAMEVNLQLTKIVME